MEVTYTVHLTAIQCSMTGRTTKAFVTATITSVEKTVYCQFFQMRLANVIFKILRSYTFARKCLNLNVILEVVDFLFIQGPCRSGEWFVIKNKVPQCETVPNKCYVDGTYVYGKRSEKGTLRSRSRNNFSTELKCWEINSSGQHCPSGQTLTAEHNSDGELQVHCSVPVSEIVSQLSLAHSYPCRMGTRRSFDSKCTSKVAIG